jgi:hypothetical protein
VGSFLAPKCLILVPGKEVPRIAVWSTRKTAITDCPFSAGFRRQTVSTKSRLLIHSGALNSDDGALRIRLGMPDRRVCAFCTGVHPGTLVPPFRNHQTLWRAIENGVSRSQENQQGRTGFVVVNGRAEGTDRQMQPCAACWARLF